MKLFASKENKNNEKVVVYRYSYTCTAPLGILDPQPRSPEERSALIATQMFTLVDEIIPEPNTDHVESVKMKENPVVEVFSLSESEGISLEEMAEAAEAISAELPEPVIEKEVSEPADFQNYSTRELMELCESLGIKARKNATRASLVEKLVAASRV